MIEEFEKLKPGAKIKGFDFEKDDFVEGEFIKIIRKEDLGQFENLPKEMKETDLIHWKYGEVENLNRPHDLTII